MVQLKEFIQKWQKHIRNENGNGPKIFARIEGLTEQQRHDVMNALHGCFQVVGDDHVTGVLEIIDDGKPISYE